MQAPVEASELVVALDGPSGSGKSSVARALANSLGLRHLDTGAMYRAVTWWMLHYGVDVNDPDAVAALAGKPELETSTDPDRRTMWVDGEDVSGVIRSREVSAAVSAVSAVPEVRRRLAALQADAIGRGGIVVEGRDIGTVVAPCAPVKVFLTASGEERARRRARELAAEATTGYSPDALVESASQQASRIDTTHTELARRDRLDTERTFSPLTVAEDAVLVDSTALPLGEVVDAVLRVVRERSGMGTS